MMDERQYNMIIREQEERSAEESFSNLMAKRVRKMKVYFSISLGSLILVSLVYTPDPLSQLLLLLFFFVMIEVWTQDERHNSHAMRLDVYHQKNSSGNFKEDYLSISSKMLTQSCKRVIAWFMAFSSIFIIIEVCNSSGIFGAVSGLVAVFATIVCLMIFYFAYLLYRNNRVLKIH